MNKRNTSLILVLAMILCLIPATAFASADLTTSGSITDTVEIATDTTIATTVNVEGANGKIIVKDGATLTIANNGKLLLSATSNPTLVIEEGACLKIEGSGLLKVKNKFENVTQLGTIIVEGNSAQVVWYDAENSYSYIGTNGVLKLDNDAVITRTPLVAGSTEDGYKYEISGGTATTNNFPNYDKDELVVASGATLDAKGGLTLGGSSKDQLTVMKGGKLVTKAPASATETTGSLAEIRRGASQNPITSGTYTEDPSSYLATGYSATNNGDGTWTVNSKGYLSKIAIVIKKPVIGETPADTYTWTVNPVGSATAVDEDDQIELAWFKVAKADYNEDNFRDNDWKTLDENEKFQKDYVYVLATLFSVEDGYEIIENFDKSNVTINGKEADFVDFNYYKTEVSIAKVFEAEAKSPVTADNNELGLFAVAGLLSVAAVAILLNRKRCM